MNKFFVDDISREKFSITDIEIISHATKSLRLKTQEIIELSDGFDNNILAKIIAISKNEIVVERVKRVETREKNVKIDLFQGVPKSDKFDYIIKQSVEIGVNSITPVQMKRSISKIDKNENKIQRFNKVSHEAAKQSKRGIIPIVNAPISINEIPFSNYNIFLTAYENESFLTLKKSLIECKNIDSVGVLIGPEGGIDNQEIEFLRKKSQIITLGNSIMRTQTAPIYLLSCLFYEFTN